MRMRAGFISNSSTSSFVLFFGAPEAPNDDRGNKTDQAIAATTSASSELSPEQCLKTAVEGAMESGWLDPLLEEMYRQIEESDWWYKLVKEEWWEDEEEEDYEDEEEEDEGEDEEEQEKAKEGEDEGKEPEAKKSRMEARAGEENSEKAVQDRSREEENLKNKGKKMKKMSAREKKRWAALRAKMTEYLTSANPGTATEYIEEQAVRIRHKKEFLEEKKKKRKEKRKVEREKETEEQRQSLVSMAKDWMCESGYSFGSDHDTEYQIKDMEENIEFAESVQPEKEWCVEYSCSNQDGDMCSQAMHAGLMDMIGEKGKYLAVFGENRE